MPLEPCPDCEKPISTKARACPHCGRPGKGQWSDSMRWSMNASLVMFPVVAAFILFGALSIQGIILGG
jgi:predicted amidophosphoribosyltransferase